MGLKATGFEPTTYDEWLLSLQTEIKKDKNLGPDVDLSTGSWVESVLESLARQLAKSELNTEDVYDSRFVSLAEGTSLDRLAANYGVSRNLAQFASTSLLIKGTPGYAIDAESMFSSNEDRIFETQDDVVIGADGTVSVKAYAEETGEEYNCAANTITDQVMYVEEIESVTNPEAATGGADMETDYDLRRRLLLAQKAIKSPTPNGVQSALYEVAGVKSVLTTVNNEPTANTAGDPPYTTHIYVLGGDPQTVAQTISDNIALGITLVGSRQFDIPLINGDVNHVAFSDGKEQPIYFSIKLKISTDNAADPGSVMQDVKDNIEAWIDELDMGDPLKYAQVFGVIFDVDGVDDVVDLTWGTDKESLGRTNIALDNFSVATTGDDAIEVINDAEK